MGTIEVLKPGLLSMIQDEGRSGYYHLGIPPSGALDQVSFRSANLLLGNDECAAAIECALLGPELRFTSDTFIAITGASMIPVCDGEVVPRNTVIAVRAGQTLTLKFATAGARTYLAVAGGIDVPQRLGSRSTYRSGTLGGFDGRPLQAGDILNLGQASAQPSAGRALPEHLWMPLPKHLDVRVIPGLYDHRVERESVDRFYSESWTVASEADRVGYRLQGGTPLSFVERVTPFGAGEDPSNIVDACYPVGSIQVPSGQQPIILHRDAVSGGGYMMVGTVISADMDRVGQLPPGSTLRFQAVSMDQALQARAERAAFLDEIRTALAIAQ